MCSKAYEGGYILAWLCLFTVANFVIDGNAAYADLTSTEDAPFLGLSQASENYSMKDMGDTYSILGAADTPLQIPEGNASAYTEGPLPFPPSNQSMAKQEGVAEEQLSRQRPPERGVQSMVITEAYLVGHYAEQKLKPPDKPFWIQRMMILGLFLGWMLIGHRASSEGATDGVTRAFLAIWAVSLLMSLLGRTPEHSHVIIASTGANGQGQTAGSRMTRKSTLRKVLANVLSAILTLFLLVVFGPVIFFVTGVLLAAMLAAVLGIAICLLR
ncbi:hypothetical protein, conserved [Eimeria praecox]|uniref:Uncharacterized protein n=1 Tax=Eimeria praecox TaxID=51316 RepID=U6GM11_9EIME|nr:hypothetical protein, conserved [Eimeria praecox]